MQFKSDTQNFLKSFCAFVSTQFNHKVKRFRTDNGKEFTSMHNFFKDEGILYEHSCVSTPQQNSVIERKHSECSPSLEILISFAFNLLG